MASYRNALTLLTLSTALWSFGAAHGQTRIIVEPFSPNGEPGLDFQTHTNDTPFVGPGATIKLARSSESYIWLYQHGIDLEPTSISSTDSDMVASDFTSIGGRVSRVLLPLPLGLLGPSAARVFKVNPKRRLPIGTGETLNIRFATGSIALRTDVICGAGGNEALSKLTGLSVADEAVVAGGQSSMRIILDQSPPCQGQPLTVTMPSCFQAALANGERFATRLLRMEATDKAVITLPLFAAESGAASCQAGSTPITVTSNGVTKTVPIRYFLPASSFAKPKPLVPQVPGALERPAPVQPGAPVAPRPKPPGGG